VRRIACSRFRRPDKSVLTFGTFQRVFPYDVNGERLLRAFRCGPFELSEGSNHRRGYFRLEPIGRLSAACSRMPRKLRVEYAGAVHHVMSRRDRREAIFLDDVDRQVFLKTLAEAGQKTDWQVQILSGLFYGLTSFIYSVLRAEPFLVSLVSVHLVNRPCTKPM